MPRAAPARALLLILGLLHGCRAAEPLPTLRRIPVATPLPGGATLEVDSTGVPWLGLPGRLVALDSTGAVTAAVPTGGDTIPRLLWRSGDRLVLRAGNRLLLAPAAGGDPVERSALAARVVLRDPGGRWIYLVTPAGGVVGVDTADLTPRWGWPEVGGDVTGAAISPLGDRLYVAVDAGRDRGGGAWVVRDVVGGGVLLREPADPPFSPLLAAGETTLVGLSGGEVVRFRPGLDGAERVWLRALPAARDAAGRVRVDRSGRRVAVLGPGGRLFLLDGADGRVIGEAPEPLDAAFDPAGRLYLLEEGGVRVVR
jgi:hypothetical protein